MHSLRDLINIEIKALEAKIIPLEKQQQEARWSNRKDDENYFNGLISGYRLVISDLTRILSCPVRDL